MQALCRAYVFDKRQIAFNGMAFAPFGRQRNQGTEWMPEINWWRPPYIASFKSGNFDFVVLTSHIRWGGSAKERVPELQAIADWVSDKQALLAAGRRSWDEPDIFVMGDFNVPSLRSSLFKGTAIHTIVAMIGKECVAGEQGFANE